MNASFLRCIVCPIIVGAGWNSAWAQPLFDQIVGDALTVQASASGRTGTITIPRTRLVQPPGMLTWKWTSDAAGIGVVAGDGTVLGSFYGSVTYDPGFDNIDFDLGFIAGASDTRFVVRSADLTQSFTSGGDSLTAMAQLLDHNHDGATLTCLIDGFFARAEWNGVPQVSALLGFSAPPGGSAVRQDDRTAPYDPYLGTKVLREDFTLTASDSIYCRVFATTSIPGPSAITPLLLTVPLAVRRRR